MAAIVGGPAAREKGNAVLAAAIEKRIEEDRQSTADPFADETATTVLCVRPIPTIRRSVICSGELEFLMRSNQRLFVSFL